MSGFTRTYHNYPLDRLPVTSPGHLRHRSAMPRAYTRDKEGKALVPTASRPELSGLRSIRERGVEDRAKRRTCQNSNGPFELCARCSTDGKAAPLVGYTPGSVRGTSRHLRRAIARSIVAHDAATVSISLRSSSTGVPRRPRRSQGEGTSHAPAMSEESSTPLRRGVHTLTRPISIRA